MKVLVSIIIMWIFLALMQTFLALKSITGLVVLFNILWLIATLGWLISFIVSMVITIKE